MINFDCGHKFVAIETGVRSGGSSPKSNSGSIELVPTPTDKAPIFSFSLNRSGLDRKIFFEIESRDSKIIRKKTLEIFVINYFDPLLG